MKTLLNSFIDYEKFNNVVEYFQSNYDELKNNTSLLNKNIKIGKEQFVASYVFYEEVNYIKLENNEKTIDIWIKKQMEEKNRNVQTIKMKYNNRNMSSIGDIDTITISQDYRFKQRIEIDLITSDIINNIWNPSFNIVKKEYDSIDWNKDTLETCFGNDIYVINDKKSEAKILKLIEAKRKDKSFFQKDVLKKLIEENNINTLYDRIESLDLLDFTKLRTIINTIEKNQYYKELLIDIFNETFVEKLLNINNYVTTESEIYNKELENVNYKVLNRFTRGFVIHDEFFDILLDKRKVNFINSSYNKFPITINEIDIDKDEEPKAYYTPIKEFGVDAYYRNVSLKDFIESNSSNNPFNLVNYLPVINNAIDFKKVIYPHLLFEQENINKMEIFELETDMPLKNKLLQYIKSFEQYRTTIDNRIHLENSYRNKL